MNDRDRLIELIADIQNDFEKWCVECAEDGHKDHQPLGEYLVDKLLQNGVIVPPCKVGDDIWWIDTEANEINCAENDIKAICYYGEGNFKVIVCDEETPEDIGTEWCMLTKEEAERALKEREQNG